MTDSYTYSSKQYKVIIKKVGKLFTFAVVNEDTQEFFQSQELELKRISQQTLNAAFNDQIKNITNQIQYEDQENMKITIKVVLDFLPQFSQDILLKKIKKSQQQVQKIQHLELATQIQKVQRQLEEALNIKQNKNIIFYQKGYQNVSGAYISLWQVKLDKGIYVVQLDGLCLGQAGGGGQYYGDQDYNEGGYYGSIPAFKSKSNFLFQVCLDKEVIHKINHQPFDYSNYEYPYSFSFLINVEKQSSLNIDVKDDNGTQGTMNGNKLILQKVKLIK